MQKLAKKWVVWGKKNTTKYNVNISLVGVCYKNIVSTLFISELLSWDAADDIQNIIYVWYICDIIVSSAFLFHIAPKFHLISTVVLNCFMKLADCDKLNKIH